MFARMFKGVFNRLEPRSTDAGRLREISKRLKGIEADLSAIKASGEKVWLRVRHMEPALQAIVRDRYFDPEMLPYPERLMAQRFRLASQNQEDGITLALLKAVGVTTQRFVELGSGLSGGNSAFLASEYGWTGLMVDGDADHMRRVARRFPRATAVASWITRENVNELILSNGLGGEVDLFSLDIDGNDYWVWEAMTACQPRVVILEYNSIFGSERSVTIPYDPKFNRAKHRVTYYGVSLSAWAKLAARKGYRLVAVEPTGVNAYFVRNDLAPHVPACEPARAYRMLEKYENFILDRPDEDIFKSFSEAALPLVEIS